MDKVIDLIKEKPLYIPRILINNYKNLKITDEELIIIIVLMSYGEKVLYDPSELARIIDGNKRTIMKVIDNLCDKNILSLVIEKKNSKTYEYISLENLYEKLFNIVISKKEDDEEIDNSVFSIFENELGRTLSSMEYEKIKEWINSGNNNELIICALREAVMNDISNFNYIDRILDSWRKKGYKTREDILKDKEKYRNKKEEKVNVFDTDWLNE